MVGAKKEKGREEKLENDDRQLSKLSTSVRIKIKTRFELIEPFSGHCLTIKNQSAQKLVYRSSTSPPSVPGSRYSENPACAEGVAVWTFTFGFSSPPLLSLPLAFFFFCSPAGDLLGF